MGSLLITCTQPRADEIVSSLNDKGLQALEMPALKVTTILRPMPHGDYNVMLISSPHALKANLPDLPVLAVGTYTATATTRKGLYVIHTGQGGIHDMDLSSYKNILYPAATEPRFIPAHATHWPVYETAANPDFSVPPNTDIICVYSIKAASIIKKQCKPHHIILCLSQSIADCFPDHPRENLAVCDRPRYDAMKELIIKRHVQP